MGQAPDGVAKLGEGGAHHLGGALARAEGGGVGGGAGEPRGQHGEQLRTLALELLAPRGGGELEDQERIGEMAPEMVLAVRAGGGYQRTPDP